MPVCLCVWVLRRAGSVLPAITSSERYCTLLTCLLLPDGDAEDFGRYLAFRVCACVGYRRDRHERLAFNLETSRADCVIFLFLGYCVSSHCVRRTRYARISRSTSALCATRTTSAPSGWSTTPNSSSAATCRVVARGNMTQPHHPLHPTAHSKHSLQETKTK